MQYAKEITWDMPGNAIIDMADRALLLFYSFIRKNSRRLTNIIVTFLPLMVLLVGSCKTSEISWAFSQAIAPERFREALFPDRVNSHGADYYPAAGYVSRAQTFVIGQPQSLMMLTEQEISYLFGKPTLHRRDADAEVWQYKAGSCVVDFYFYNNNGVRGQSQLSYVDVRTKRELIPGSAPRTSPVSTREQSDCLHDVVEQSFFGTHA